jgi:hypothetical protein
VSNLNEVLEVAGAPPMVGYFDVRKPNETVLNSEGCHAEERGTSETPILMRTQKDCNGTQEMPVEIFNKS